MNRYPLWKYLLILAVVVAGFIYALPNIYPSDPVVQISSSSAALQVDQAAMKRAANALDGLDIKYFGDEISGRSGIFRLYSLGEQLKAQRAIQDALGENYVAAVNLAPNTPEWLVSIGAGPMKLGLDLAGGVHFLLEVDTPQVLADELQGFESQIRRNLVEKRLRGVSIRLSQNELVVTAKSDELRGEVTSLMRKEMPELEYERIDQGGEFLIRARLSSTYIREKEDYAVTQNLTTLRNRVNEIGVAEPLVQRQGRNRIVVELPGVQDTAWAKSILGKTANLEFRLEAKAGGLASQKEYFERKDEQEQEAYGGAWLEKRPIIRGDRVTNAQVSYDQDTGLPQVAITLDGEGGRLMHRKTRDHDGERMGVLFIEFKTRTKTSVDENGKEATEFTQIPIEKIASLATIRSALGKNFVITGAGSVHEASELALLLRAGALAAPMGFVEERTIGPSMGAENIALGVKSVQLGLALVLIFMLVYYRVFGIAANFALAINLVLLVSVMSLFGATLTLPGIAGIVLTVGMAVDANVLIFSRIREELKNDMPPQTAIRAGFERAFQTILDANITTFIVAIVLYAIGSGPIKGFAVTLAIGIVTSMFTAIFGTRAIVNIIYGGRRVEKLWI